MQIRVYYEDTDAGGVVYYSNYLKYCERARTEFFRDHGIEVAECYKNGSLFVVAHVEIAYKSPAEYNDLLDVASTLVACTRTSFTFHQRITHSSGRLLAEARIKMACINDQRRPSRLPQEVNELVQSSVAAATQAGMV